MIYLGVLVSVVKNYSYMQCYDLTSVNNTYLALWLWLSC